MNMKQTALAAAALWVSYWLAGLAGSFFGFGSPQGMAGSAVFFCLMAIALVVVQKKLKESDLG